MDYLADDVCTMTVPSPKLFHTHLPYMLPDSIKISDHYKIIYLVRNPNDTIISIWNYFNNHKHFENFLPLEEVVKCFFNGIHHYGPFYEHVLKYWKECKMRLQKNIVLEV